MKQAKVYFRKRFAGILREDADGYTFAYDRKYLESHDATPVSLTLPLTRRPYKSRVMIAFFDGLIPEGWLLNIAEQNWKINNKDRMSLLLACCKDCIGAVSIISMEDEENV